MKLFSFMRPEALPQSPIAPVQQPKDMSDEDRAIIRTAAHHEIATTVALRSFLLSELATSMRWVQASLLVVNGGAAIAVLQSSAVSQRGTIDAGAAFAVGVVLSLLSAYIAVMKAQDVPVRMTQIIGYWLGVSIDLLRSEEIERDWQEYARTLPRRWWLSRLLGWGSLAAFGTGCVLVGLVGLS